MAGTTRATLEVLLAPRKATIASLKSYAKSELAQKKEFSDELLLRPLNGEKKGEMVFFFLVVFSSSSFSHYSRNFMGY